MPGCRIALFVVHLETINRPFTALISISSHDVNPLSLHLNSPWAPGAALQQLEGSLRRARAPATHPRPRLRSEYRRRSLMRRLHRRPAEISKFNFSQQVDAGSFSSVHIFVEYKVRKPNTARHPLTRRST